jgi:hypothetical protein
MKKTKADKKFLNTKRIKNKIRKIKTTRMMMKTKKRNKKRPKTQE